MNVTMKIIRTLVDKIFPAYRVAKNNQVLIENLRNKLDVDIGKLNADINDVRIKIEQMKRMFITSFSKKIEHRRDLLPFDTATNITKKIGDAWNVDIDKMAKKYYEHAENYLITFWGRDTVFNRAFEQLDCSDIVELACGHGRHVTQYLEKANTITLVDINQQNIDFCKKRFAGKQKIEYLVNQGNNFNGIGSNSQTAVFCYDAMVHFEMLDIIEYIKDANRILVNGGKLLFHHSNADYSPERGWHKPHGRNFMSADIFAYLALRHGFIILTQDIVSWGTDETFFADLDCLSLCKKVKSIEK